MRATEQFLGETGLRGKSRETWRNDVENDVKEFQFSWNQIRLWVLDTKGGDSLSYFIGGLNQFKDGRNEWGLCVVGGGGHKTTSSLAFVN